MKYFIFGEKCFELDDMGCLRFFNDWQIEFAEGLALEAGIEVLTDQHKKIIKYLRDTVEKTHRTPIVHRACRENGLKLRELEKLFPTGYHRGACLLAGLNYFDVYTAVEHSNKTYRIDRHGFLIDFNTWDTSFAAMRAEELGIKLTARHWHVINFMREHFAKNKAVPTVFETCSHCELGDTEFELLFPTGYHRGALKIAGLSMARSS